MLYLTYLVAIIVSFPVSEDTVCLGHVLTFRQQLLVGDFPLGL